MERLPMRGVSLRPHVGGPRLTEFGVPLHKRNDFLSLAKNLFTFDRHPGTSLRYLAPLTPNLPGSLFSLGNHRKTTDMGIFRGFISLRTTHQPQFRFFFNHFRELSPLTAQGPRLLVSSSAALKLSHGYLPINRPRPGPKPYYRTRHRRTWPSNAPREACNVRHRSH